MKTLSQISLSASALLLLLPYTSAQINTSPATNVGCFSSADTLTDLGFWKYQSSGYCKGECVKLGKAVFGLSQGSHCYCGDKIPTKNAAVSDSNCGVDCVGFPQEKCGGSSAFMVFLSGISDNVPQADGPAPSGSSSTGPSSTVSAPPSTITQPGQTVVVTASGQAGVTVIPTPSHSSGPSGPNKAGIAAGVVVAIVIVGAIILGVWLFIRNRRKRAVEEEYRRNVAINSFTQKSHHTSSSMSDSRLEPSIIGQRRMSDGSIADNQDYSRRILKVTNPS